MNRVPEKELLYVDNFPYLSRNIKLGLLINSTLLPSYHSFETEIVCSAFKNMKAYMRKRTSVYTYMYINSVMAKGFFVWFSLKI